MVASAQLSFTGLHSDAEEHQHYLTFHFNSGTKLQSSPNLHMGCIISSADAFCINKLILKD